MLYFKTRFRAYVTEDLIYDGKIIRVVKLEHHYEVVRHAAAVAVLIVRGEGDGAEVLLVSQHRPAVGARTWELPAGLVDDGETPEQAAVRELAEEVGLGGTLQKFAEVYSSPGFTDEKVYLFEATELYDSRLQGDEGDDFEFAWKPLRESFEKIAAGELQSSGPALLALSYALGKRGGLS